jgi:hypothetical protein
MHQSSIHNEGNEAASKLKETSRYSIEELAEDDGDQCSTQQASIYLLTNNIYTTGKHHNG